MAVDESGVPECGALLQHLLPALLLPAADDCHWLLQRLAWQLLVALRTLVLWQAGL